VILSGISQSCSWRLRRHRLPPDILSLDGSKRIYRLFSRTSSFVVMVQKGSEPGPRQADYSKPVGAQYLDVRGAKPWACFGRFSKEETGPKLVPPLDYR